MRLEGREWRVLVDEVRLGAERFRVVRPRAVGHMPLYEGQFGAHMSVDRQGTVDLAVAWWLAIRSARSLVYLPLRKSGAECGSWSWVGERRLDLVLLHHSLGFKASRWKEVRGRLGAGRPHKIAMPQRPFEDFEEAVHRQRRHREFRDALGWSVAADTLFIVGSRRAFEFEGWQLRGLAEDSPAKLAREPETHCCAEIDFGRDSGPDAWWQQLHVECCNRHW